MDAQLTKKTTLFLTLIVIGITAFVLLHTAEFSAGLFFLCAVYVAVVLIRDYVIKLDLHRTAGILYFLFQLALASVILVRSESFIAQAYILVLVGEFTFHHSRNRSIVFTAISYGCGVLTLWIYRGFPPFEEILYLVPRVIEYAAIFGISFLAKIAFQQKNQLALDNEQLRIASIELERKAKLQERTRISREIHDSVGHMLTSALTGLQTAARALEKNQYPLAKEMIDRTKEYILRGLDDVRSSVHLLHETASDIPFIPGLVKLIEETKRQTGVNIDYEIGLDIPDLPPLIELTVYRALQEGLSNGIRHGSSTHFRFSLAYQGGRIRFMLSDNGESPSQMIYGFGLNAMKERVREVGGEMCVSGQPGSGGTVLELAIPFQAKNDGAV